MKEQLEIEFDVKRQKQFTLEDVEIESNIDIHVTFIDKQEELEEAVKWLQVAPKRIGVDIETRGLDPHQHDLIMFQFGDIHRQFVIDTRVVDIKELMPYIVNDDNIVVGQNLKFEYKFIKHNYKVMLNKVEDTMLQEQILYNGKGLSNSLKALAERYLGYTADKTIRMRFLEIGDDPFSKEEIIYGAYDVVLPLLINKEQRKVIKENKQEKLAQLEHAYLKVLGDMEYRGMFFDSQKWIALYNKNLPIFESKKQELSNFVIKLKALPFIEKQLDMFDTTKKCTVQWTSSKQVVSLFKYLNICPMAVSKTTKKLTYTVDAKVIKASLNNINKDISDDLKGLLNKYLEMKELEQRVTTFGLAFLENVNPVTKRLHSSFRQIISTGRSSSSAPNLQNIPSDPEFRECFSAPKGYKIVNADYSGQETVILADKSKESNMLTLIKEGKDMHSFVTRHVFTELLGLNDIEIKLNHKEERQTSKAAGFAINYGGTGFTIANNLGISEARGDAIYEAYFKAFPQLRKYFDKVIEETLKRGYIITNDITNRRLYFKYYDQYVALGKNLNTKAKRKRWFSLKGAMSRLALNAPVQGTAGDITKMAAVKFRKWVLDNNLEDKVFLTLIVHDELNVESEESVSEEVAKNLSIAMESAGDIWVKNLKLKADAVIGDYWAH